MERCKEVLTLFSVTDAGEVELTCDLSSHDRDELHFDELHNLEWRYRRKSAVTASLRICPPVRTDYVLAA